MSAAHCVRTVKDVFFYHFETIFFFFHTIKSSKIHFCFLFHILFSEKKNKQTNEKLVYKNLHAYVKVTVLHVPKKMFLDIWNALFLFIYPMIFQLYRYIYTQGME